MKSESVHIQMKATEQRFPVGLFPEQVGSSFKCVDEILECRHLKNATEQHFHNPAQLGSSFKQCVNEVCDHSYESY